MVIQWTVWLITQVYILQRDLLPILEALPTFIKIVTHSRTSTGPHLCPQGFIIPDLDIIKLRQIFTTNPLSRCNHFPDLRLWALITILIVLLVVAGRLRIHVTHCARSPRYDGLAVGLRILRLLLLGQEEGGVAEAGGIHLKITFCQHYCLCLLR